MRKPEPPAFQTPGKFSVKRVNPQSILLQSSFASLQITALAPGLFRLRIARGKSFSTAPSWAISRTAWPPALCGTRTNSSSAVLETTAGKLTVHLRDGSFQLTDKQGRRLFTAGPAGIGFAKAQARLTLSLTDDESIFGLGETTGAFNKRGLIREFWNTDVLGHAPAIYPSLRHLYVSIPFAISLRQGRAGGIFWDNPARQNWDIGQTILDQWQMTAASGEIDLYLFIGPTVPDVVSLYTELTGNMPMPPIWALGYHQCRYSYETRKRVEQIAREFRRRKIPCDALYLDIHHMDGYRVFTFGKTFPKPRQMLSQLAQRGFKVVAIVDPGVKDDPKFGVLKRGRAAKAFVKDPAGKKDYLGKVWPGKARFPDFLNARVRGWWGDEQAALLKPGIAGFWNDMNEPANFALPTKTLPETCRHHTDSGPMRHSTAHNLYGMQMARASRDGALLHQPGLRPFVITRAGYAGVQRHAMVWTGDNSSNWEHLSDAVQMFLNLGVSGLPFCGGDIGGFLDNTTPELLVRWLQMATFTPFYRNHSNLGTIDQEPWAFGPKIENICRRYINLRYQLLPYIYGLFVEAHRHGAPVMRPLVWHHQADPVATATSDQFLLGKNLLVAPILRQGATARAVYLPRGEWFNFWTGEPHHGAQNIIARAPLDLIPIYVRAGTILPMSAVRQSTSEKPLDTITLHLWPGVGGQLHWYEDDEQTTNYLEGDIHERLITTSLDTNSGHLHFASSHGHRASRLKTWRIILRASSRHHRATLNGQSIPTHFDPPTAINSFEIPNAPAPLELLLR